MSDVDNTEPSFQVASGVEALGEGRFRGLVPDGWQQGRGAFGGLGIGIAARAMEAVETERPLRALTAELPGPLLPGEVEVRVASLRRGTGMTTLDARILQDGETKVRASGVFGRARVDDAPIAAAREVGDWRAVQPLPAGAMGPPFSRFFEYRVTGPIPFTGGREARVEGWTRPLGDAARWSGPEVVAMADAYWPALFSTMAAPRPMATVTYTLQLTAKAHALEPGAPLFFRSRVLAAEGGFVSELRELFAPDGALVAINPQTFVIIK